MKLLIEDKEYDIKDITIDDYEFFVNNPKIDDITFVQKLTKAPIEDLKKAKYSQIKFIANMLKTNMGKLTDKGQLDLVCEIDGVKYGLMKPSELSYEEWINLEVFMAEKPLNLALISTHLYKPLKNDKEGNDRELIDYDLTECKGREELFAQKMPIKRILSAFFFIATFAQILTERFLDYTTDKKKMKKRTIKMK